MPAILVRCAMRAGTAFGAFPMSLLADALRAGATALALVAAPLAAFAQQQDTRPTITVAVQQISNSNALDVLQEQSNVGARVFYSLFEPLIDNERQTAELKPKPGLATAWRRIDDRTLEVTLRQGVKFHDGSEMTADDVVFTYSPARTGAGVQRPSATTGSDANATQGKLPPPAVTGYFARLFPNLERVEAVDRYTVRFINKIPDVTLEGRLARNGAEILPRAAFEAAADWTAWVRKPVGTGPYRVVEFRADNMLVLEAHDDYWGGRPPIKTLRFVVVPELAARVNGLLSGQYDFITDIPPDQVATITANSRYEVTGGPVTNHRLLVFDKNHPRLADARIRRALTHAIDRKLIADTLFDGRVKIPAGLQWEFYGPMFIGSWTTPAYDPELARRLLREAGYNGEPIPFRVLNNYYNNQVPTSQILVEMWRQVGINVQIEMKENWAQIMERTPTRAMRDWSNSAPFNDPVSSLVNQHCPGGFQQASGEYANEEFNRLCKVLEEATDPEIRRSAFARMLEIAEREDPAYTVLHQTTLLYGKRRDIEWTWSGLQSMDFRAGNFRIRR